ncbi:MAG: hypothetical protein H0V17_30720 [Deltaproteobacteria bacterium]|nr:hypothetical protein [Deltaproteobacteria bacterium]
MKRLLVVVSITACFGAACGGGGGFPTDSTPEGPPPGGKFMLSWTVTDLADATIPCAQVGASFVTVTLRNRAEQGGSTEVFACSTGSATSLLSFTPGIYDLTFQLSGMSGAIGTAPAVLGVEIVANQTVTVSPIAFPVDNTGKLELFVNTGEAGGNCTGGADVDNFTITLTHTGAACEPVTFDLSNGPPNSYTVDCANPALSPCIDNDQKLSVATLPSGSYRVEVKGKIGGVDCWSTTQTLNVPPNSKTLMQTLNLTHLVAIGC